MLPPSSAKEMLMQVKRYANGGTASAESSVGLARALANGTSQEQYYQNIRDYVAKTANPLVALNAATENGVSTADINRALGTKAASDYFTIDYSTETAPSTNVATGFTSKVAQAFNAPGGPGQKALDARIKEISEQYAAKTPENAQILRDLFIKEGGSIADLQRAGVDPSVLLGVARPLGPPPLPELPPIPTYTPPVVTPQTQTQFPQPTTYTAPTVYQPLPAPPPIYATGQPALDVNFRNSAPRSEYGPYGYTYSPAAKLLSATGAGMSFTPPSVTSRPRSLLNVPLPIDTGKPYKDLTPAERVNLQLSSSQYYARNKQLEQDLAALNKTGGRFSDKLAPVEPVDENESKDPMGVKAKDFRDYALVAKGGEIKKSEGSAQEELARFANGGPVATDRKPLAATDPLYIQTDTPAPRNPDAVARPTPMSHADLLAQIDRGTAASPNALTPERDPVKTESAGMLARLNQAFYENVSKPAVGTLIDMSVGLGDLAQKGTKYLANRAGIETKPFTPVSPRIQEAAGTAGYNPYTIGGLAAGILPFARGQQLAGSAANSLRGMFPNLGRETAAYVGGEAGAAAAGAALPDSTAAELFGSFVGGTAGSVAGAPRTQIDGPRILGEDADALTALDETPAQPGTAAQMLVDVTQIDNAIRPTITTDIGDRRRVGTTGRYVGAPEGVDTQQKLGALTRTIKNLTKEGEFGKFWYERSGRQILDLTAGNKDEAEKIIQAIAITSARTPVASNFDFALQAYYQWKNGEPIRTGMFPTTMGEKLQKMFDGEEWAGRKTNNFYNNLMREVDPSKVQGVTTDLWMMRAFGFDTDAPTDAQYGFVENETKRIAQDLGWEPQQVQAAIWVALKSRMENTGVKKAVEAKSLKNGWLKYDENGERVILDQNKHAANWLDTAMKYSPNDADREAAKFDYANAAENNLAQISWESIPSRTSGHMPEIFAAAPEAVQDYHVSMSKAFLDDQGKDIIAQEFGILSPGDFEAPGYFELLTSPGTQTLVAAPKAFGITRRVAEIKERAKAEGWEKDKLDAAVREATYATEPAAKELMMAYAAVRGILLKQDGVGLHKPSFGSGVTKPKANGIEVSIGRPFTADETSRIAKIVAEKAGHTEYNPIGSPDGVRFINFEYLGIPNTEFQKIVKNALKEFTITDDAPVTAAMFGADTGYAGNNWTENLNGEGYLEAGGLAGRPDLQRKIRDIVNRLAPRVSTVEDEFANRYGWTRNRELNRLYEAADEAADEAQIVSEPNIPPTDGGVGYVTKKANGGDVFPVKSNASSSRRMLDDLIGKKPKGQRVDATGLLGFANGGDASSPMSNAELLAQMDRIGATPNAKTPNPDPVKTESRNMLQRFTSLNTPKDMSLGETVADIGMGFLPVVGTAQGARDFERARRDDDTLGMVLSAASMIPIAGGAVKAARAVGKAAKAGTDVLPPTESAANLAKFLEGSVVVDESGKPKVFYHGTSNDFDEFDRERSLNARSRSMDTVGNWFSDNPGKGGAELYGRTIMPVFLKAKNLKKYSNFDDFLRDMHEAEGRDFSKQNPKGVGSAEGLRAKLKDEGYDGLVFPQNNWRELEADEAELAEAVERATDEYRQESRRLRGLGLEMTSKDGKPFQAKIDRLVDALTQKRREIDGVSREWADQSAIVVFDPTQIKSAIGNVGTFDPTNPVITKAQGGYVTKKTKGAKP